MADKEKPLRSSSNKIKDIYNTYVKNEEGKVIPIDDSEAPKSKEKDSENTDDTQEKHVEEKDYEKESYSRDEVKELVDLANTLEKEKGEIKDQLLRTVAEYENFRRRTQKEKQEMLEYANEKLLMKMLELLDDIDKAAESGKDSNDYDALLTGVEMIQKKANKLFEESGVKHMNAQEGEEFDVNKHDALLATPSDLEEGKIVQVVQKGYMLNDKVLRHAKVVTSSGKPDNDNE